MAVTFRVYGTVESVPSDDDLIDFLEENNFEDLSIETEEVDSEDEDENSGWAEWLIYEPNLDEPVAVTRIVEDEAFGAEIDRIVARLSTASKDSDEVRELRHVIDNCVVVYAVELPEEYADNDEAMMLTSMVAQFLAQKSDGIYCVDEEGFFNDAGDLIYEAVE